MSGPALHIRKLGTLLRAGPGPQAMVAEATIRLWEARLRLAFLPFCRAARARGWWVSPGDPRVAERACPHAPEQARIARRIGWAVRAAAPYMPFRAVCLHQALAAQAMLRRRGIGGVIHFGTARQGARLAEGHAWLDAGGVRVTGYPVDPALTEIGCLL